MPGFAKFSQILLKSTILTAQKPPRGLFLAGSCGNVRLVDRLASDPGPSRKRHKLARDIQGSVISTLRRIATGTALKEGMAQARSEDVAAVIELCEIFGKHAADTAALRIPDSGKGARPFSILFTLLSPSVVHARASGPEFSLNLPSSYQV